MLGVPHPLQSFRMHVYPSFGAENKNCKKSRAFIQERRVKDTKSDTKVAQRSRLTVDHSLDNDVVDSPMHCKTHSVSQHHATPLFMSIHTSHHMILRTVVDFDVSPCILHN